MRCRSYGTRRTTLQDLAGAEGLALRQLTIGVAPSSAKVYASHVKRFRRWCGSVQGMGWPPDRSAAKSYELSLMADGVAPMNARNAASVIGRFLALLEETSVEAARPAHADAVPPQTVLAPAVDPEALILASLGLDFGAPTEDATTMRSPAASGTAAAAGQLVEGLENMLKTLDAALLRYVGAYE